jgi:hypothetical protein
MFLSPQKVLLVGCLLVGLVLNVVCECRAEKEVANSVKIVLSPQTFFGNAQAGYDAAQQIPDICSKLFCYCGCEAKETDDHSSLLDCFTRTRMLR